MDITPIIPKSRLLLTGYGSGGFKINGQYVAGSILLFPESYINWPLDENTAFAVEHFSKIENIELLLFGTGKSMRPVPEAVRSMLRQRGIATEAMDTGAACRTYNILLSEERKVAAALIAV